MTDREHLEEQVKEDVGEAYDKLQRAHDLEEETRSIEAQIASIRAPMPDKKLRELALDIVEQRVFGTWNIPPNAGHIVKMVFMPLALSRQKDLDVFREAGVFHFYEYVESRNMAPRSINGYPIFWSMRLLGKENWDRLVPLIKKLQSRREDWINEEA